MTAPGSADLWSDDDEGTEEFTVRPYTVTGGRTRPANADLPVEALVEATADPEVGMTPERRRILELTRKSYLSIAELSAHVHLPVGVVRVVVSDLSQSGKVRVHGLTMTSAPQPATTISVLESVLNGISSL
ncbi:DUF742 domain-containing protein [Kineococcus aurantiacus]|uniref:DUF742 domain-containing protein n=1 Tax=Kineococcus aurantiacus TaxID=37633 RepID=A0A7Y9DKQ2_9ACTN|nr:hypothetical protein [Kineococcus aurantiacus]